MARTVAIGQQDFETIRVNDYFYIDKTRFIREWWKSSFLSIMRAGRICLRGWKLERKNS